MRYFVISDNTDTQVGLRLAGVEGVVARSKEEAEKAGMGISEYTRYCINRHWDYMYCARKDGE